jgi:hypothetical protein
MARMVLTSTVGSGPEASYGNAAEPNAAIAAAVALVPSSTAVAADIAVLVADGASPTQGHVNTLNTDWGTFLTALTAYNAAVAALGGSVSADVSLLINGSNVLTKNKYREIIRGLSRFVFGSSLLSGD